MRYLGRGEMVKKIIEAIIAGAVLSLVASSIKNMATVSQNVAEIQKETATVKEEVSEVKEEISEVEEMLQHLEAEEPTETDKYHSLPLGHYTLTAYEWTGNTCTNGEYPSKGYTIACNSLPLGTRVYIEGYGFYTVEDRGGMADNVIDIYLGDYDECIEFGVQEADVYLIKED